MPARRPSAAVRARSAPPMPQAQNVYVTRLHVRYDGAHFPEDLVFQETGDRENFQGRYILRHPWTGSDTCSAADEYRRSLPARLDREARTLSSITGWRVEDIRKRAGYIAARPWRTPRGGRTIWK